MVQINQMNQKKIKFVGLEIRNRLLGLISYELKDKKIFTFVLPS